MTTHRSEGGLLALGRRRALRWVALVLLLMPQPLWPATIPVSGPCTLVDAIDAANADAAVGGCPTGAGADTLTLSGDVTLTLVNHYDPYFGEPTGLPTVSSDVTVAGGGFVIERDGAAPSFRIFVLASSGTLTLNDVTVRGGSGVYFGGGIATPYGSTLTLTNSTVAGNSAGRGGGVYNRGTATLTNSTLSGNSAGFLGGGGVMNYGTATLTHSTLSGNSAGRGGGGVFNYSGTTTLTHSTLSGNSAYYGGGVMNYGTATLTHSTLSGNSVVRIGGGVWNNFTATLTLTNSTLSGNSADELGGGVMNYGTATLTHSTLSGNSARLGGGGVYNRFGATTLTAGIVANSPSGGNCVGAIIDGGANFDDDGSCPGAAAILAGLDFDTTLAPNGGPTLTHALLAGSVAQDAAGVCGLATDQRGVPRSDGACDSGSFELVQNGACCTNGPGTQSDCVELSQSDCEGGGGLFLGFGTQCANALDCVALVATVESMSAQAGPAGVWIRWTTTTEVDTVGFRVLREGPDGRSKALAQVGSLVPGAGDALAGGSYEVLDDAAEAARALHYWLEDIDIFGRVTRHGPIAVERGVRQAPALRVQREAGR